MKLIIKTALFLLTLFLPATATAYDFIVDGIFYNKNGNNEVTVSNGHNGVNAFDGYYIGDVVIPETVTYNDTTYTVTKIGTYAFCNGPQTSIKDGLGNPFLTSVTIPNTVTTIEKCAFLDCNSLTHITIPVSVNIIGDAAFGRCQNVTQLIWNARNCSSMGGLIVEHITELTIGDEVETLPSFFISSSDGYITGAKIKSLHIPASVTSIGNCAFAGCSELESITVDSQNPRYDSRENCNAIIDKNGMTLIAGCKNTIIPSTVVAIGDDAFYGSGVSNIDIPIAVTSIGSKAFYNCSALTGITLPSNLTKISEHTFHGCSSLSHINIPSSVSSIGIYAFNGCTSLASIEIPGSVTSIGMYAFANCKGLSSISLPTSISIIDERTFVNCCNLSSITIPNAVATIGIDAFNGCTGLTSLDIPNSVTSIGNGAFTGCRSLTHVSLPSTLTAISKRMFSYCSSLRFIDIPPTVTYIGEGAFKACNSLTNVVIPDSSPIIEAWAFCDCSNLEHVTIPNTATKLPIYTFAGCTALNRVTCLSSTPPAVDDEYTFDRSIYVSATLSVPADAVSRYYAANGWKKFKVIENLDGTLRGDINDDHIVNISDVNAVIDRILTSAGVTASADVNHDGAINISDINTIIGIILNPGPNECSLQVWQADGNVTSVNLNDMPRTTYHSNTLIITTKNGVEHKFAVNNIVKLTYTEGKNAMRAPQVTMSSIPGMNIRHMTIHLKNGDYTTLYLENLNEMSTSKTDINGIQHDDMFYNCVSSRNGQLYYAINEIDSITFGSSENLMPQTYHPISITHLYPEDILPELYQFQEDDNVDVANAVHIADMMWEHGAGDYTVEQYQHLMDRLCNVMTREVPKEFDNFEFLGISADADQYDYYADDEMRILNKLLKHNHVYACLRGNLESGTWIDNNCDVFIGKYANEHPDKIFIAGFGTSSIHSTGSYNNSGGEYSRIRESYKSENLMLFSKIRKFSTYYGYVLS